MVVSAPPWAEVCPSLPTGRRLGRSGRAARLQTSPPVSRLLALSAVREWRRRPPRQRTRARGTSRPPRPSRAGLSRTRGLDRGAAQQGRPRRQDQGGYRDEMEDRARHHTVVCRRAERGVRLRLVYSELPGYRDVSPIVHDTPPIPSSRALRPTGEVVLGNLQSVAMHTASYTARVIRSTSSKVNLRKKREGSHLPPVRLTRR
jgi:hypothetical protein